MKPRQGYSGPERRHASREGHFELLRDLLFGMIRWIGQRVRGLYTVLGLFLSIAFLVALLAAGVFTAIADWVVEGKTQQLDESVLRWMAEHHTPSLDVAALEITSLGSGTVVWMTVFIASAFLWASRHRLSVLLLWVAVIGGIILNLALKAGFDRPRPSVFEWRTPYAGQSSFPSGHAMTAVVVYWTLAFLVSRLESSPLLRTLTWVFVTGVILLIGASRLYLGVHYPSDVLAGFVIGFVWATFCSSGIEVVRYFRGREPEVERVEQDLDRPALGGR
ncbi:MAG TPA: phosphatase PAP2 family protein [Longimicrobiaceae bacterium]|nr:phosphatase PAP2 family protein [Longimicrobiaceae bacterium]